ncbi:KUP/HAK/KT family potassium transporter [Paraburkholderia sediminicola]
MVTPAVSVPSAVKGLRQISMKFDPFVGPAALAILVALFAFQRHRSGRPLVRTSDGRVVGSSGSWWSACTASRSIGTCCAHCRRAGRSSEAHALRPYSYAGCHRLAAT